MQHVEVEAGGPVPDEQRTPVRVSVRVRIRVSLSVRVSLGLGLGLGLDEKRAQGELEQ